MTKPRRIRLAGLRGGASTPDGGFIAVNATAHGVGPIQIELPHEALGEFIGALLLAAERSAGLRRADDPLSLASTLSAREVRGFAAGVASTRAHVFLRLTMTPGAHLTLLLRPEQAPELAELLQDAARLLRQSAT